VIHHPAILSSGAVCPGFAILKSARKSWQVMGKRKAHRMLTSRSKIASVFADEIVLLGTTMDIQFYHGRWSVIANDHPIPAAIPFQSGRSKSGMSFARPTSRVATTSLCVPMSWDKSCGEPLYSLRPLYLNAWRCAVSRAANEKG
jgi:hypothetical protein